MSTAIDHVFEDVREELRKEGWGPVRQVSSVRLYDEHEVPSVQKLPLRLFVSEDKAVVSEKPVEITIFSEGNMYYAENDALKIYAASSSVQSAIQEFSRHVVYFFNYYREKGDDEVVGRAVILKEIYDDHFDVIQPK